AEAQRAIGEFVARIGETPGFVAPGPDDITSNPANTVVRIDVPMINADDDSLAERDLETLRGSVVPETLGTIPGATVATTGMTASSVDFNQLMRDRLPLVFAFVLGLAFLLLLITFRSLVIPVMSIVLNLLSVAAAYGVMVLVFQHGWASSLLGFEGTFGIVPWLPLFMFVVLFGLSMDYHVFILSRIRELRDRGMTTEDAVTRGISATAGVVTSAAAVMVAVFAIFGSLSMISIKQMGVGLAVAVLLDATIVRAVLLPATMKLLGEANWYLPRWLQWLPHVQVEESAPERVTEPVATPAEA
ncbi:MAG: MMPL family transporter, partial [Solirubrobacterales bacterium]